MNITLALVLLAIPPILTNAYVGVREVDPEAVDAARGMGMTRLAGRPGVELPLALPLIFGGIRISAVNIIATATLGPEGGVVTLGDPIINPSTYGDAGRLGAAIVVAAARRRRRGRPVGRAARGHAARAEALPARRAVGGARASHPPRGGLHPNHEVPQRITRSRLPRSRCWPRLVSPPAATTTTTAARRQLGDDPRSSPTAGIQRNEANAKTTITVGSKNFTEQIVLGEIYAQAFEAAGYKVRKEFNLGDEQTALKSLKGGQISGYPEYTGTILLSFLDVPGACPPSDARGLRARQGRDGRGGHHRAPADAVHELQRGRRAQEKADELGVRRSPTSGKARTSRCTARPSAAPGATACSGCRRSTAWTSSASCR